MKQQTKEDVINVTPAGKTFTHAVAGTLEAGKSYDLDPRTANRLLKAGLVNPSSGEYSTKVIANTPVVGNANPPSTVAGATAQSSASPAAQASPQTTVPKSTATVTKPKKRGK